MAHLLRLHSIENAQRWLVGLNPNLGDRRPVDLIHRRRTREVLDAIANERAGGFARGPWRFSCVIGVMWRPVRCSWHLRAVATVRRRFSPIGPWWWC
ncbi:DUF2384 domain-containing protein [Mycolicibacter longobardus]|nr:DUF2384 domain-containing protein [Mycolicibacter longobardus]